MSAADNEGLARARRMVNDNQMPGATSEPGYVEKPGTRGTGHDGNGTASPFGGRARSKPAKTVGPGGRKGGTNY